MACEDMTDKRVFRAWVRASHPDHGGDTQALAVSLERLRQGRATGVVDGSTQEITVFRRPRTPLGVAARWWGRRLYRRERWLE